MSILDHKYTFMNTKKKFLNKCLNLKMFGSYFIYF